MLSQILSSRKAAEQPKLTEKQVDDIEEIEWKEEIKNKNHTFESCPICYIDYEVKQKIKLLECGHAFHINCVKEWLLKNPNCPICKNNLLKNQAES